MNVDEKNVFSEFKKLIVSSSFTDEQILKLSDKLGLYFANSREGTKENSRTQIRKFFDLVKKTKASAESAQGSLETVRVKLRLLQAQVAYAMARDIISKDFKELFDISIEKVIKSSDEKALSKFASFFESFYAYFYFHTEILKKENKLK